MKAQAQRMVGVFALTLAAAAVMAGAAQAEHPNDRAGMLGVGGVAASQTTLSPDWFERAVARDVGDRAVIPNDRGGMLGVGGIESQALQQSAPIVGDDRSGLYGPGIVSAEVPSVTTASDDGFQWGDAGFGAAAALGMVLLGMAAALAIRHRSRVSLP
jgi:hypothetical protein